MEELINVVKAEVMSSLEIAEITGKRHRNVMRDIRNLVEKINQLRSESANNSDNKIAQLKFELGSNVTGNQHDTKPNSKYSATTAEDDVLNFYTGNNGCTNYIVRSGSYKDANEVTRSMFTLNKRRAFSWQVAMM
jgi:phage regulator Rha-like protein